MRALVLRLDAPLVSFGGPMVDQNGVVQAFPALSMLTGILANALGWDHRDSGRTQSLQERIRYAARIDRLGQPLVDYQTVDLGQPWMVPEGSGWTTRGTVAVHGGGSGRGTHQRWRHYRADSVHTVALTLVDGDAPSVDDLAIALTEPARPLFIGRKCCLPASRIFLDIIDAESLVAALATIPRVLRADAGPLLATWWDGDDDAHADGHSHLVAVTDERDWRNQIHVGRRLMREGRVNPPEATHE